MGHTDAGAPICGGFTRFEFYFCYKLSLNCDPCPNVIKCDNYEQRSAYVVYIIFLSKL